MACEQGLIFLTLVALSSFASAKNLDTEDLRSDQRSAISLAAETDIFIGQIAKHRLLPEFRSGHAGYLRGEAEREVEDLRKSKPRPDQLRVVQLCIEQLDLLADELAVFKERKEGDRPLSAVREMVTAILKTLNAARAGL